MTTRCGCGRADEKNVQIHQCWVDFNYNPLWITPLWSYMSKG